MAKITTRADGPSSINYQNPDPTNGPPSYFFHILQTLLQAGWTHWASGTGASGTFSVTPGNVNLQITNAGTGAGGLDRNNAWFILRCPANKRQILIQRSTASTQWRIYYSALDTFNGTGFGTVSATIPPSATDQGQVLGVGGAYVTMTAANSPAFQTFHCVAFSDAVNTDVYSFFAWSTDYGAITTRNFFVFDGVDDAHSADADPVIMGFFANAVAESNYYSVTLGSTWAGWYKYNLTGETWVAWSSAKFSTNTSQGYVPAHQSASTQQGVGPDLNDAAELTTDMMLMRPLIVVASQNGIKGRFSRLRGNGVTYRSWPSRQNPSSADAMIAVEGFWVPWLANTKGRI